MLPDSELTAGQIRIPDLHLAHPYISAYKYKFPGTPNFYTSMYTLTLPSAEDRRHTQPFCVLILLPD